MTDELQTAIFKARYGCFDKRRTVPDGLHNPSTALNSSIQLQVLFWQAE